MKAPHPGLRTTVRALAPGSEEWGGKRALSAASTSLSPRGLTGLLASHPKSQKLIPPRTEGKREETQRVSGLELPRWGWKGLTAGTPLNDTAASVAGLSNSSARFSDS